MDKETTKRKSDMIGDLRDKHEFGFECSFLDKDNQDIYLGIECLKDCIDQNYEPVWSRYYLALSYNRIEEYDKEYKLYEELLLDIDETCDFNGFDSLLCNLLGRMNCEGKGTTLDYKKGYDYFIKGIRYSEMIDNYISIGDCYLNGWYVNKNFEEAFNKYQEALKVSYDYPSIITNCEASRAMVLSKIGKCYLYGYGVEKDLKKAYEYYNTAMSMDVYLDDDAKKEYESVKLLLEEKLSYS